MSINYSDPQVQFAFTYTRKAVYQRLAGHLPNRVAICVAYALESVLFAGDAETLFEVPADLYDSVPLQESGRARAGDIVAWYEEVLGDLV